MMQLSRWKVILVLVAAVLAVVFASPNVLPQSVRDGLPGWVPKKTLNLGLDLRGGSSVLMEVDTKELTRGRTTKVLEDIRTTLTADGVEFSGLSQPTDESIVLQINDPAKVDAAFKTINNLAQPAVAAGGVREFVVERTGQQINLRQTPEGAAAATSRAVDQSREVINRRIDALGTTEPDVVRQGANRILVQAPGDSDPDRLIAVIGQTARLSFQMVDLTVSPQEAAAGLIPPGSELLPSDENPAGTVVRRREIVTGEQLVKAQAQFNDKGQPTVSISFNGVGARSFGRATTENVGKPFAIILDERVVSAPVINEPIPGGQAQITMGGGGDLTEAKNLEIQLNAGSLPAKLTVEERRTVTAALGKEAVEAGLTATVIAFVGVLVFMILAYGLLFGGIAVVALVVNGALVIAAMSVFEATLSLPGIAGLILTLAMAVDANVLIYERMRDEVRAGRTAIMAMDAGFSRAMVTIIDANLTTLIAALIMFIFGAGPVRGFAWTLSIGLFTSVFTAVLITQVLLALWFRVARPKALPIA